MNIRKGADFFIFIRNASTKPTTNGSIKPFVTNRNPRNLEKLRLQKKPCGFSVDLKDIQFWNRLNVITHPRYVTAQVIHYTDGVVIDVSTNEWAIKKYLYSTTDKQAYIILAKVFAERCMESGITSMKADFYKKDEETNMAAFLKVLEEEGLSLEEADYYNIYDIWRTKREKKPWTVLESSNVN